MVQDRTFPLGVAGVIGSLLFISTVYLLCKHKRRLKRQNRVQPWIDMDNTQAPADPVVNSYPPSIRSALYKNIETTRSLRKDATWRIIRRAVLEFIRITAITLLLVYIAPSWNSYKSTTDNDAFSSILPQYIVIPLVLFDFAVIPVAWLSWKRLYIEQKVAYGLYCLFLGLPCGTITKVVVSMRHGGTSIPDWALFTSTVVSFAISVLAVFLYFIWCGCFRRTQENGSSGPDCRCFFTGLVLTAILFIFSVFLVAVLHFLWPDTVSVKKDMFNTLEFLDSNWIGRLTAVWIILSVVFLFGTGTLMENIISGRLRRAVWMLPDLFLFYGYSTFVMMAAYEASYPGSFTPVIFLYLPIVLGELLSMTTYIMTILIPCRTELYWKKKTNNLSYAITVQPPSQWGIFEVSWWLTEVTGVDEYCSICERHKITGKRLQEMSKIELDQIGITCSIHRKRIKLSLLLLASKRNDNYSVNCETEIIDPWTEADDQLKKALTNIDSDWIHSTWLSELGLSHLSSKFQSFSIDGALLFVLNRDDLTSALEITSEAERESLLAGRELLSLCRYNIRALEQLSKMNGISDKYLMLWSNHDVLGALETLPLDCATGLHGAYILHPHFHPRNAITGLSSEASILILEKLCWALQKMTESVKQKSEKRTVADIPLKHCGGQDTTNSTKTPILHTKKAEADTDDALGSSEYCRQLTSSLLSHYSEICLQKLKIFQRFRDTLIQFQIRPASRATLPPLSLEQHCLSAPAYWEAYNGDLSFHSIAEYKRVQVTDPLLSAINMLVTTTWITDKNETGQSTCQVESIDRIENPRVFLQYQTKLAKVERTCNNTSHPDPPVSTQDTDIAQHAQLKTAANEYYLWHRAHMEHVDNICRNGLESFISTEELFGSGIHFKERSSNANQLAFMDSQTARFTSKNYLFLVRVCMGNFLHISEKVDWTRPPCMAPACTGVCTHQVYNSVIGQIPLFDQYLRTCSTPCAFVCTHPLHNPGTSNMTAEAETQILLQEISTFAFIGERNLGKGKFVVSTTGLHWCAIDSPSSENLDFHVPCKSVVVHAISRDISAFPEECIYCMIDDQFPLPGDQDGAEERDDPDDKSEECSELRFVPEDKSLLDQIYAAIVECQNLNPDTESEDSSDDEGRFEDSAGDGNGWIFAESNGQQDGDGQNDIVLPAPDEFVNMVNEQQETGETDEMMDVGQFDDVEKSDEQDHS